MGQTAKVRVPGNGAGSWLDIAPHDAGSDQKQKA